MSGTDRLFVVVGERNTGALVTRDMANALKATVILQPAHVVVIDVEGGQWEFFESEFLKTSTDEAIGRCCWRHQVTLAARLTDLA